MLRHPHGYGKFEVGAFYIYLRKPTEEIFGDSFIKCIVSFAIHYPDLSVLGWMGLECPKAWDKQKNGLGLGKIQSKQKGLWHLHFLFLIPT